MRVAVLADIHGNLPACEAVLEDIRKVAPDYIVAAGDLALRGAHPREVVELVFDRCNAVLMGNTDCYLAGSYLGGAYRERDHWKTELLRWTRDQLGSTLTAKLGTLPFSVRYSPRRGQDLYVCHANPKNLEESLDPTLDEATVRKYFQHLDAAACAFGHLHFPYRRRVGRLLIADVASAGIPRDGDLRPAYGVFTFTPKGWRVQIRRVRYPVRKATQALTARRVPGGPLLIHKLVEARYRHHAALQEAARRHSGLPPTTAPTRALGMPVPGGAPGAPRLRRPGEPAAEGEASPAARRGFASVPADIRSALDGAPGAAGEDPAHPLTAAEADALDLDPGDPHAVDDLHEVLDAHEAVPLDDVHGADVHGADVHGADVHGADVHGADEPGADEPGAGEALAPPAANEGSGAEAEPPEHPQRAANGDTEA